MATGRRAAPTVLQGRYRRKRTVDVITVLASMMLLVGLVAGAGPAAIANSGTATLFAGQDIPVGTVDVTNDGSELSVTYRITEAGWYITETHLAVGDTVGEIPQTKKGNPIPGRFAYSARHDYVTEYTYTLPLGDLEPGDVAVVAAHAVVERAVEGCCELEEGAWAGTGPGEMGFPGANWATYFTYTVTATLVCPQVVVAASSNIELLATQPSSVVEGAIESNTLARVFHESGPVEVTNLALDDPYTTYSGTVCSYYLHTDPVEGNHVSISGSLVFDGPIRGLIESASPTRSFLDASSYLGAPGTTYPDPYLNAAGVDLQPWFYMNEDTLSFAGNTLTFTLEVRGFTDDMRIILDAIPAG